MVNLFVDDGTHRAGSFARAAFDADVLVDAVDIALRDRVDGATVFAGTTSYTFISNSVCHNNMPPKEFVLDSCSYFMIAKFFQNSRVFRHFFSVKNPHN